MTRTTRTHPSNRSAHNAGQPTAEHDDERTLTISCTTCAMQGTAACADCIVTHILSPAPTEQLTFTVDELRAVTLLASVGLVPTLQHREAR